MSTSTITPLPQFNVDDEVILTTDEMRELGKVTKTITPIVSRIECKYLIPNQGWHYKLECVTGFMPEKLLERYIVGDESDIAGTGNFLVQVPVTKKQLLTETAKVELTIGDHVAVYFFDQNGEYNEEEVEYGMVVGKLYDGFDVFLDYVFLDDENDLIYSEDSLPHYHFVKMSDEEFQDLIDSRKRALHQPVLKVIQGAS